VCRHVSLIARMEQEEGSEDDEMDLEQGEGGDDDEIVKDVWAEVESELAAFSKCEFAYFC